MKKTTRFTCLALTLVMLLLSFPATVFANDTPAATTPPAQGVTMAYGALTTDEDKAAMTADPTIKLKVERADTDEVYYCATFNAAMGAIAYAGKTDGWSKNMRVAEATITLLASLTDADFGTAENADGISFYGDAVTIEGNGYSISGVSKHGNFMFNTKGGAFTVQNLTVNHPGFWNFWSDAGKSVNNPAVLTIKNCDITTTKHAAVYGNIGAYKVSESVDGAKNRVIIQDSKLTMTETAIKFNYYFGALCPISIHGSGSWSVDIQNSTLTNQSAYTDAHGKAVIHVGKTSGDTNATDVTLSMDANTVLDLALTGETVAGCTYVLNNLADATTLTLTDNSVKRANAKVMMALNASQIEIKMVDGAAVRTDDRLGLRYTILLPKAVVDDFVASGAQVSFGYVVAPNKYVKEASEFLPAKLLKGDYIMTDRTALLTENKLTTQTIDGVEYYCYYASVIDLPKTKTGVNMEFAALGYLTIEGTTVYTDFSEEKNVASVAEVAKAALETDAYKDNATFKELVALAESN